MVCVVKESNIELPFTNSFVVELNEVLRNISVVPDYLQRLIARLRYDRGLLKTSKQVKPRQPPKTRVLDVMVQWYDFNV